MAPNEESYPVDQSKKTMRHFYCRDVLWETFEQMANDFDCSIDYLVNEAMRYYARSKNYQNAGGAPGQGAQPARRPSASTASPVQTAAPAGAPPAVPRRPAPPTPGPAFAPSAGASGAYARPSSGPGGMSAGASGAMPMPGAAMGPTLFLLYNGQRYPVTKDQFIIGRGSKTSDLPIKDGNISRKHCAVIRRNGTFYIKDLGSTNGIDYKGMRIDNKRIDEGDVFHLCDYELRFTYRTD
ncbi:MAG: FHA domain-containing protein [Kofleriaceae bacterium]